MTALFGIFPVPEAEQRERLVEQVLLADRLGLDLVGIQDHPYQRRFLETWTLLSYLAGRTERIRLFPDVASLPLRSPALLAKAAASLDLLSGGRAELGLGAGAFWEAIGAWGGAVRTPKQSVDALEEAIEIIRRVWAGERGIRFEGEHYRLSGAHGGPEPAHAMGIWLGAYGPRMLRLVGSAADGWVPSLPRLPLADVPARQAAIDAAARAAGRDPADDRAGGEHQRRDRRRRGHRLAPRAGRALGRRADPARDRAALRRAGPVARARRSAGADRAVRDRGCPARERRYSCVSNYFRLGTRT